MTRVTATELQNNFGKYLQYVLDGNEIVILKNNHEVARLISKQQAVSFLTNSLVGVLNKDVDEKKIRKERAARYENLA